MTNKMNIDMGDFFGGGESQPAKKEAAKVTSRFGFGLMGSRRSSNSASSSSRLSAKQAADDSFDNPLASAPSRPKDNKTTLASATKPMPSPIITSPKALQLASPDFKVSAKPPVPEPKLLPRTGSVRDPKPPQFLPPKSPQNAPKTPSPVLTPKGSQVKMQAERTSSSSPSSQAPQRKETDKSPPPLPPRKLSPRGSVDPAILEARVVVATEKDQAKSGAQSGSPSSPADPLSSGNAVTNTSAHVAESKPREDKQLIAPQPSAVNVEATRSVTPPSDITSAALDNEVRSQVAPWTVWAEDPEKTLANDDLRSQVAPWTTEPEPEPDRRKTLVERQSSSEKPTGDENIAMEQFFAGKDDDFGTEEEFTNPLHAERREEEEETVSKTGLSKKTWIGSGRASQASPSTARITQAQKEPEKPKIEPKKAIDYGEIFKTPAMDDDDDANAFFNDPEFKDAPDFEW